jgi:fructose-1,6-bisphosphatase/inositol monophosphatase family enzyme
LDEAARTEIMPRFRRLAAGDIRAKSSPSDLVTEADTAAERWITAQLNKRFPGVPVLGEEAVADNPSLADHWPGEGLTFTLDPVDGTFNFACDVPVFGVMLAAVLNGETIAAVILDPVGGDYIMAEKGAGAFLRRPNGTSDRLRVAAPVPAGQMLASVSWQSLPEPERSLIAGNHAKFFGSVAYRCAAQEYRLAASGFIHFVYYNKLNPWDHLPGVLIHAEAGGYSRRKDGSLYRPLHRDGGLLCAPDKDSWQMIRETLWRK